MLHLQTGWPIITTAKTLAKPHRFNAQEPCPVGALHPNLLQEYKHQLGQQLATSANESRRIPVLSRSQVHPTQVKVAQILPYQDWINMKDGEKLTMTTRDLPGVVVTMPAEDYEAMLDILRSHYDAVSTNPAVNDAWVQYKMLQALTNKQRPK